MCIYGRNVDAKISFSQAKNNCCVMKPRTGDIQRLPTNPLLFTVAPGIF
jgi:hypothetical protein